MSSGVRPEGQGSLSGSTSAAIRKALRQDREALGSPTPSATSSSGIHSQTRAANPSAINLLGRSYHQHRPFSESLSASWTESAGDIRASSARLGSLGLTDGSDDEDEVDAAGSFEQHSLKGAQKSLKNEAQMGKPIPGLSAQSNGAKTVAGTSVNIRSAPSGLSLAMLASGSAGTSPTAPTAGRTTSSGQRTPIPRSRHTSPPSQEISATNMEAGVTRDSLCAENETAEDPNSSAAAWSQASEPAAQSDETTPLLLKKTTEIEPAELLQTNHSWSSLAQRIHPLRRISRAGHNALQDFRKLSREDLLVAARRPIQLIPAVILGILMNLLDGVSYGMIMFRTDLPLFANFGGIGVSMFFASCLISQIVYSTSSIFKAGNGSMMIEIVPFLHQISTSIYDSIGDGQDARIISTTMFAYAFSSILTGIVFFSLGAAKLGQLIEFFPRHILVGCVAGIGAFLVETGLTVTARMQGELEFNMDTLRTFMREDTLPLWTIPLALAVLLRIITHRYTHPLIVPAYFIAVPIIFYICVAALGLSIPGLRESGWIFELDGVNTPWYTFYTLYDFGNCDWGALIATIPTQLALCFFAILHVPINVPALALSIGEDGVKTDTELVNHGVSNVLAGLLGTIPNYLCYVNSVLFYRIGGDTRLAGFMLAIATAAVMLAGPGIIGYLPVMVVGALIHLLGIDLLKEGIWDTWGRVSPAEYATIWIIIIAMTVWDFVVGIGVGIVVACAHFVVTSSQRRAIRSIISGETAKSTVRRPPSQSAFLREVGSQTRVIRLQGFLFFGTTSACETAIREILDVAAWSKSPIRFLVLDFTLASGVDFSAAEAFLRVQRLCETKSVGLVLCGCPPESPIGRALRGVDLWAGHGETSLKVFESLNDSLEHCENSQLRSLYSRDLHPPKVADGSAISISAPLNDPALSNPSAFEFSPRRRHLASAAGNTLMRAETPKEKTHFGQPMLIFRQAFRPFATKEEPITDEFLFKLVPHFHRVHVPEGTILWRAGDPADGFFLIESGMLRAEYDYAPLAAMDRHGHMTESMLPGTVAGELTFLSGSKRNTTVTAERDAVLWRMDSAASEALEEDGSAGIAASRLLWKVLLRISKEEQEVLMGHLITSL
ncbi:hypothetical protein E5Q_01925 [Mixia osmundae IAM 14324]|uniref:STAS domain-containing protein n=1 Tax=Mixia osmundae (strain CBS 9802 / IAM 14324 / JCM 22182 / KY 12970) TaxID=764103 RepID=G7DXF9_MIXOS|nr:hypothetical protein E5Q_01925 [Mixia osmundae IAM 14324]